MKDYYAILGVHASASATEVKRAFRKLAFRYHPDKNPGRDAPAHFQEINEAYDVLGDANKRAGYDALRSGVILESPPQRHPDPAYRRKRTRPPGRPGPPQSYILMRKSLPYMLWISRVSILFTLLFFIDFWLPYSQNEDHVRQIFSNKGQQTSFLLITHSGEKIQVDNFDPSVLPADGSIRLNVSRIFGSVMSISIRDGVYSAWVGYMYTTHVFFPILLFVNSLLALVYRKRVEFCFNLNVTGFVLLILNLALI